MIRVKGLKMKYNPKVEEYALKGIDMEFGCVHCDHGAVRKR